jgi:hypothetical protein
VFSPIAQRSSSVAVQATQKDDDVTDIDVMNICRGVAFTKHLDGTGVEGGAVRSAKP